MMYDGKKKLLMNLVVCDLIDLYHLPGGEKGADSPGSSVRTGVGNVL